MLVKQLFGAFSKNFSPHFLALSGQTRLLSSNLMTKTQDLAQARLNDQVSAMEKEEDFDRFKEKHVQSFEEFKQHPYVKAIYADDQEKLREAYEGFCVSKYLKFKYSREGNDPINML